MMSYKSITTIKQCYLLQTNNGNLSQLTSIVNRFWLTAVSKRGKIVSNPGNPGGAFSDSFSCKV